MKAATTASPRGQSPASSSADSFQTSSVTLVDQTNVPTASVRWTRILNIIGHSNAKAKPVFPRNRDKLTSPVRHQRLTGRLLTWHRTCYPTVAESISFLQADDPPPVVIRLNPPAGSHHARKADSRISEVTKFNPYIFPSGKTYVFPTGETPPSSSPIAQSSV